MDKDKRKKLVKDSMKSRIASINRSVASPKYIAKELYGLDTKKLDTTKQSDWFKAFNLAIKMKGESGGRKISDKDIKNALKKVIDAKKKGKPHLKKGGKAKKKYGVVGKPTLRKGGKA